jgi:hypothetical protein
MPFAVEPASFASPQPPSQRVDLLGEESGFSIVNVGKAHATSIEYVPLTSTSTPYIV